MMAEKPVLAHIQCWYSKQAPLILHIQSYNVAVEQGAIAYMCVPIPIIACPVKGGDDAVIDNVEKKPHQNKTH